MKKLLCIISLFIMIISIAGCKKDAEPEETAAESSNEIDEEKLSYSLGVSIGNSLKNLGTDIDIDTLAGAIKDVFADKELTVSMEDADTYIQESLSALEVIKAEEAQKKGAEFLAENGKKEGVITTESGLQYTIVTPAEGPKPGPNDSVSVHYTGTLIDESVFDSSVERGEPVTFEVGQVIPGWAEGIQLMSTGSKYKFFIPSDLAYGPQGAGNAIGPNEALIFEVELLEIIQQ